MSKRSKTMKTIQRLCVLILMCLLVGCNNQAKHEKDRLILFATPLRDHSIWLKAKEGFDDACNDYGVNCLWKGPVIIDVSEMNDVVEKGIMQNVDAIITQGVISEELIEQAYEKGIPVLLVDSDMSNSKRISYMGKDFEKQARLLLKDIEEKRGKDSYLKLSIQVAEKNFAIATQQIEQIEHVFQSHPGGFEIVNVSESKSDAVRSKKEWMISLESNPDINVAINFAAESAQFCGEAAIENHIREQLLIYGVDDMESTLNCILAGTIDGTIVTSFYDYGYRGVEILLRYLENEDISDQNSPELKLITKDNYSEYETKDKE